MNYTGIVLDNSGRSAQIEFEAPFGASKKEMEKVIFTTIRDSDEIIDDDIGTFIEDYLSEVLVVPSDLLVKFGSFGIQEAFYEAQEDDE